MVFSDAHDAVNGGSNNIQTIKVLESLHMKKFGVGLQFWTTYSLHWLLICL